MTISLAKLFVKEINVERGVYSYALAFANSGYIGDPIALALFGEEILVYYKLSCLPITIMIHTWRTSVLTFKSNKKGISLKRLLNALSWCYGCKI